jgi:hypothetical protein
MEGAKNSNECMWSVCLDVHWTKLERIKNIELNFIDGVVVALTRYPAPFHLPAANKLLTNQGRTKEKMED